MTQSQPQPVTSPLLDLPGAVAGNGIDAPVAAHYGSFNLEQRALEAGEGFVDLSHHDVVRIEGPDRLTWLHSLTTQHLLDLQPGVETQALILSPQGHVEHEFRGIDDGEALTVWTEPGRAAALVEFLERMKFMMRAELTDVTADLALTYRPARTRDSVVEVRGALAPSLETPQSQASVVEVRGATPDSVVEVRGASPVPVVEVRGALAPSLETPRSPYELIPRAQLSTYAEAAGPAAGLWAYEALRIARGEARFGLDTDHRTIPNEMGWIGPAVHLDKGCYRGQETVARVHTLGRPPRRLTLLHLDGSENQLPRQGAGVVAGDKVVGFVGTSARHHELGPIALAVLKRNTPVDVALLADGLAAAQEVIVDPEVGLHVRPRLR